MSCWRDLQGIESMEPKKYEQARTLSLAPGGLIAPGHQSSQAKIRKHAEIGTFNRIFGMVENQGSFVQERTRESGLTLGEHTAIRQLSIRLCRTD